jgi:hypothetical protein
MDVVFPQNIWNIHVQYIIESMMFYFNICACNCSKDEPKIREINFMHDIQVSNFKSGTLYDYYNR